MLFSFIFYPLKICRKRIGEFVLILVVPRQILTHYDIGMSHNTLHKVLCHIFFVYHGIAVFVKNRLVPFPLVDEMVKATDSTLLDTIMDFSKYGITDYCVYQQAISVELSEIIAVRADDTDGVKAALQSRKDSLIKQFGTYPEQEKIVSRTVVFQKGDLCFLIASEEPEKAEKAISDKISANSVYSGD